VDLQVRLIQASDAEEAYKKALQLGMREDTSYKNALGETVRCHFEGLHDLGELPDTNFKSGAEIFSLRSASKIENLVVDKGQLSVFWIDANKNKLAIEVLTEEK